MLRRLGRRAVMGAASAPVHLPPDRRPMAPEAVAAVLARNSMASVVQEFEKGRVRTRWSRYAHAPDALYLPGWWHPRWLRRDPPMIVECHVSELVGLEEWSYVWARGVATALQPSDDAVEHDAWEVGAGYLRRVITTSGRVADAAFTGYGIVRVDILSLDGVVLSLA